MALNHQQSRSLVGCGLVGSRVLSELDFRGGFAILGLALTLGAGKTVSFSIVFAPRDSLSSSEFSVSGLSLPLSLGAGQTKSVTITFTPRSSGAVNASLSFKTGSNGVSASLTGSGITAPQHRVSLSWQSSKSQVIGYNIYRGRQSVGPYTRVNTVVKASTTYADNSVQGGQMYFYVVTAVAGSGKESAHSNQVQAAIPSP